MADWLLGPAQYIRLDLVPARVEGVEKTTRVVVTDAHYYFFVDTPTGPLPEVSGVLYDIVGRNTTGWLITDEDQTTTYSVKRGAGCACGSRLRGFRPFPGVPLQR